MIYKGFILLTFLLSCALWGQNTGFTQSDTPILTFEEYMGYVKKHHPVIKQANLILSSGEAKLLKARGGFDPKIEVDYSTKDFKDLNYFDIFNATFKVPTWYGIEFKANLEENSGVFLNPERNVPDDGLYSAGISIDVLEGFLINDRVATLQKAKAFVQQSQAERDLAVNNILFEAASTYFEWIKASTEEQIFKNSLENAEKRYKATVRGVEIGDKAAIDSTESKITVQNRNLSREAAALERQKWAFKSSNFLWINEVPLQIENNVIPLTPTALEIETTLNIQGIEVANFELANHPKLQALQYKIDGINIDRRLKLNKLLPKLNLNYNFISATPEQLDTFSTDEYKSGFSFSTPLFLRKERGDLRVAKFKLQDANLERLATELKIRNKIDFALTEINSLDTQFKMINDIIVNYQIMLDAEERKFFLGESSLFLVNSREAKLIDAQVKQNDIKVKLLKSRAKLFNSLGVNPF